MEAPQSWKKTLKSGTFRRMINKYKNKKLFGTSNANHTTQANEQELKSMYTVLTNSIPPETSADDDECDSQCSSTASNDNFLEDFSPDEDSEEELNHLSDMLLIETNQNELTLTTTTLCGSEETLTAFLRNWSMQFNIPQQALKPLLQKLNSYERTLPESPRRLLCTPRTTPDITEIEGGQYWHQGLGKIVTQITYF